MGIRISKPTTAARRFYSTPTFEEVTTSKPEKSLLAPLKKSGGRNNTGRVTSRHRGGGHKRQYRIIDFKRNKLGIEATVATVEYDPKDGVIRSRNRDFLTIADVHRFYADLAVVIARSRADWGDLRHIIDIVGQPIASAEVMAEFAKMPRYTAGETDRLAIVVESSLAKMQANRGLFSDKEKAFISAEAAMTWLLAMPRKKAG